MKKLSYDVKKISKSFWQHYALWTLPILVIITLTNFMLFNCDHKELFYDDTDSYTRALRMVDWIQNFSWAEKIFPYTNYPNGFILHFTRISDIFWLLFSLPFMPFTTLKEAVFYGGFFFSPFFWYLTIITVLWGIKPYLEKHANKEMIFTTLLPFIMLFCSKLTTIFDFYRPDHHSIMSFVFAYNISALLRLYIIKNKQEIFFAGILAAIGIWASSAPEGLYVVLISLSVLTIDNIFFEQNEKNTLYYSIGLFLGVCVAWLINPPYGGWSVLNNARLSFIHVVLCALIASSFYIYTICNPQRKIRKICLLIFLALICISIMLTLFGYSTLFTQPGQEVIAKYFFPRIKELNTIFEVSNFLILPLIVGMIIICYMDFKQPYARCMLIIYILTVPLCIWIIRFYPYYLNLWLVLYSFGLIATSSLINKSDKYKTITFIYVIWPIFYLLSFDYNPTKIEMPEMSGVVLTDTFRGPELVWRQNVDTVASPYHTNVEGIGNSHTMWFTTDENTLKKLLQKHEVSYIYLPNIKISKYYINPNKNTDKLYGKVLTGKDEYPWMQKVSDRLYKVNYEDF